MFECDFEGFLAIAGDQALIGFSEQFDQVMLKVRVVLYDQDQWFAVGLVN